MLVHFYTMGFTSTSQHFPSQSLKTMMGAMFSATPVHETFEKP